MAVRASNDGDLTSMKRLIVKSLSLAVIFDWLLPKFRVYRLYNF